MATKIIELPEITTTDDNDLLLVYDGVTQALSKMKANQLVAGTGVIDGLKLKMIHLPDEYGDFNNVKWETVLKDHADGHDIAYFIIEGKGSIFKNIDLTFNSVSDYWAITSVTKDPDSGAWGQRVSFATRGDWTDNGRTFQRSGNNATNAKLTGFRKFAFTTDVPKTQPHIGNTFLGIYDDLQALQSAVSSPKAGMQAIVLQPEEDYYHVSGGQWVKLAKVQDVHAQYLGAYSTLSALRTTYPSANAGDIAIVGKGWYKYDTSWEAVGSTDLGDINSKLTRLDNDIINLQDDIKDFVAGPSSSKQGELVAFDGVTGKIVKGSGVELTSDGKISSNYIPYVDTPTDIVNMPIEDTNLRQTDNFNKFKNKVAYYTSTRRGAIGFPAWSSQGDDFPVGTKFAFYTQSTVGSAYTLSIILNRDDSLDSGATRLYLPPYTFIVIEKLPINNKFRVVEYYSTLATAPRPSQAPDEEGWTWAPNPSWSFIDNKFPSGSTKGYAYVANASTTIGDMHVYQNDVIISKLDNAKVDDPNDWQLLEGSSIHSIGNLIGPVISSSQIRRLIVKSKEFREGTQSQIIQGISGVKGIRKTSLDLPVSSTLKEVLMDDLLLDLNNDISSNNFVVPKDGIYSVRFRYQGTAPFTSSTGNLMFAAVVKNNSTTPLTTTMDSKTEASGSVVETNGEIPVIEIDASVSLKAGDIVKVMMYNNTTNAIQSTIDGSTYLEIDSFHTSALGMYDLIHRLIEQKHSGGQPLDNTQTYSGFFDSGWPQTLSGLQSAVTTPKHSTITLNNTSGKAERVYMAVANTIASKVRSIQQVGGLPSVWDKQVIGDYTFFRSSGKYFEQHLQFVINWED